MEYKIIKSESQYEAYCNKLHELVINPITRDSDEVELLTLLVEKWDSENINIPVANPIETINALMKEHRFIFPGDSSLKFIIANLLFRQIYCHSVV